MNQEQLDETLHLLNELHRKYTNSLATQVSKNMFDNANAGEILTTLNRQAEKLTTYTIVKPNQQTLNETIKSIHHNTQALYYLEETMTTRASTELMPLLEKILDLVEVK